MKETLLQRCQREAREKYSQRFADDNCMLKNANGLYETIIYDMAQYEVTDSVTMKDFIDTLIANTLKQAAEALEGMRSDDLPSSVQDPAGFCKGMGYNQALTDAQRLLLGEDNG